MDMSKNLAIVVLAAGESSRLGEQTKQLLIYNGETFLRNSVKKALQISNNIYVVLGYKYKECKKELEGLDINILYNEEYQKGIGSSISFGIKHTKNFKSTMIMLCDQPFIPLSHYIGLKQFYIDGEIIASQYGSSPTVPAVFPQSMYNKLITLHEDKGAKSILKNENCILLQLSKKLAVDIDTKADIDKYLSKS